MSTVRLVNVSKEYAVDQDCIFCRIANGELGTEFVAQSENAVVFDDIAPSAPVHMLVVPKRHVSSLRALDDPMLAAELLSLATTAAEERGLLDSGYRVITNDGELAGQTVFHLHFHVLGGQRLGKMG
jgi:histidine triad (HIT) family protein